MEDNLADEAFKILVVGDKSVGKTSFVRKFTENKFTWDVPSSQCINFYYRKIQVNGKLVLLNIYDTPSSNVNRYLTNLYLAKVDVIVILYDVTDPNWHIGVSDCLKEIKKEKHAYSSVCLIGNKQDLVQSPILAGNGNFENFMSLIDLYDVISCKDSENLDKLWSDMVTLIRQQEVKRFENRKIGNSSETDIVHKRKSSPKYDWFDKIWIKICKKFWIKKY